MHTDGLGAGRGADIVDEDPGGRYRSGGQHPGAQDHLRAVPQSYGLHELSTALSILRTAVAVAKRRGADRVEEIDVKVGKLACIDARQLAFAFGIASRGTIAEGAKLRIVEEEARVRCPECGYEGGMEYKGPAHHDFQAMASP
ncbi:TPA: hydrogenase maturation nickel metallochaperone HypA, partial [Candidatus Bathyarchaeota archaeon]|nr:hydrogenase maturation nickel metallochaperone HypA [Candidatus Bathyarchaeota archaeon]